MASPHRKRQPARHGTPPAHERPGEEEETRDTLGELLEELGEAEHQVRLMRMSETRPRKWQHVVMMDLTRNLFEDVQQQYGGGDYRAHVYDGRTFMKGKTLAFSIAGAPRAIEDDDASSELTELREEIRQLRERTPAPATDNTEKIVGMITGIFAAVTPLIAPLLKPREAAQQNVTEVLSLVQTAEARGEERGRELGKLTAGGGGDSMADVARTFMPPIVSLLQQKAEQERMPAAGAPSPSPAPMTNPPPASAEVLAPQYQFCLSIRPYYGMLASEAAAGINPELAAEYVLAHVTDDLEAQIADATVREDFMPTMRAELAPIAQRGHAEWLEAFLSAIVEQCKPEELEPAPAPANGKKAVRQPRGARA